MASLKQTINQLIPALLTLLVVVPRQAFYPKSDLNSRYFPADQISASQHRLCLTGGHLEKMKGLVKQKKREIKGIYHSLKSTQLNRPDIQI